jgi:hypothetical protein
VVGHYDAPLFLDSIKSLPGVTVRPPATEAEIRRVEAWLGTRIPPAHRAFLRSSNGLLAAWGYDRLLGVGDEATDIGPWNLAETWKFAWPSPLDDFLCVAETGWGDQYAYWIGDLRRGSEAIHRLEAHLMEPADDPVADDFEMFLRSFAAGARLPADRVHAARGQIGDLRADEHAVYSPSPVLVGIDQATTLIKMSARLAMIVNGDLASQVFDPANQERAVSRIEMHQDDVGRPRIKVHWA